MTRLLREPLAHFLLLGVALFLAHRFIAGYASEAPASIVVTPGQIEHLAANYERVHQRPPTPDELEWAIGDFVREEVYVREAIALDLDRDDAVIRQRLRQKMEFLSNDVAALAEPTDAELSAYLEHHADAFRIERNFSFRHVYLNPDVRRDGIARDAEALLERLRREGPAADLTQLGDAFLLDHGFEAMPGSEVAKQFGGAFARALEQLPPGQWQGPIESGFGAHLVLVTARSEGRAPTLAEARDAVKLEWANERRLEANERFYRTLRDRYTIEVQR